MVFCFCLFFFFGLTRAASFLGGEKDYHKASTCGYFLFTSLFFNVSWRMKTKIG